MGNCWQTQVTCKSKLPVDCKPPYINPLDYVAIKNAYKPVQAQGLYSGYYNTLGFILKQDSLNDLGIV